MAINSDNRAKIDLLNRKTFAYQIAECIVKEFPNDHESIVFGLNGIWGSGKSTLMGFIQDDIREICKKDNIKCKIYEFNPWLFSGQENLQREFLQGILEELKDLVQKTKEGKEWLEKSLKYFQLLKLVPQIGKDAYSIVEDWIKDTEFLSSVYSMKKRVDKILTKNKTKLTVVSGYKSKIFNWLQVVSCSLFSLHGLKS